MRYFIYVPTANGAVLQSVFRSYDMCCSTTLIRSMQLSDLYDFSAYSCMYLLGRPSQSCMSDLCSATGSAFLAISACYTLLLVHVIYGIAVYQCHTHSTSLAIHFHASNFAHFFASHGCTLALLLVHHSALACPVLHQCKRTALLTRRIHLTGETPQVRVPRVLHLVPAGGLV